MSMIRFSKPKKRHGNCRNSHQDGDKKRKKTFQWALFWFLNVSCICHDVGKANVKNNVHLEAAPVLRIDNVVDSWKIKAFNDPAQKLFSTSLEKSIFCFVLAKCGMEKCSFSAANSRWSRLIELQSLNWQCCLLSILLWNF